MKSFDCDAFMQNVRREAGENPAPEPPPWLNLLRLNGTEFITCAYRKLLRRDPDSTGMAGYAEHSMTSIGKIRILLALYSSQEFHTRSVLNRGETWRDRAVQAFRAVRQLVVRCAPHTGVTSALPFAATRGKKRARAIQMFYYDFENKYRSGFDATFAQLEARYAHMVEAARAVGTSSLDLGCGRGEAVALFASLGFQSKGVDSNPFAVDAALGRALDVRLGDVFTYLRTVPDASQAAVTAFHLIEHLPFERMWVLLEEVKRVLLPEGLLLLETPNIRNMLVAAGDFYRDPTHIQHVFPDTLDFLLHRQGFEGTAYFFAESGALVPFARAKLDDLHDYVRMSRDMAWIGRKF